jgi:hypothetical protein
MSTLLLMLRRLPLCLALAALCSLRAAEKTPQLTDTECAAFGEHLAELFDNGQAQEAVALLDVNALLARITDGLGLTPEETRGFRKGATSNLAENLTKQYSTFPSARFLRVQQVSGEPRVLIRLVSEDGAANYTSFICARDATGKIRWVDAFLYVGGDTISQASRNAALPLIAEMRKGILDKLTSKESAFAANIGKIHQASLAIQNGKADAAWSLCEKLPKEVKTHRMVLTLRLRAAQAIDDVKYLQVIQDWEAAYPNDPTLDFVSIDGAILRKDYPAALKHIRAFGKQLGGDVYLDYLASNVLLMSEKYDEARTTARAALTAEPSLLGAFDTLLTISLKTKNYADTVSVLDEFQGRFPTVDVDTEIVSTEDYAEFRLSKAYLEWPGRKKADAKKPE